MQNIINIHQIVSDFDIDLYINYKTSVNNKLILNLTCFSYIPI